MYLVRAAATQTDLENNGSDCESTEDTLAAAKIRARYYLSEEFRRAGESSSRLGYAQVVKDGECVFDVFAN